MGLRGLFDSGNYTMEYSNSPKRARLDSTENEVNPWEESVEDSEIVSSQPSQIKSWQRWTVDELANQLTEQGIAEEAVKQFKDNNISGSTLHFVTQEFIRNDLNVSDIKTEFKILEFLSRLGLQQDLDNLLPDGSKVFNDPVHGHMEFHPLIVAIIDTPQFQRLRYLKQLGACYFVYPGAAHNRFEHCLGVCHLAGQLVTALRKRQPRLGITNRDVLCVMIAGLCHDLGHGPFSHLFDNIFIPYARPDRKWEHEEASVAMFDYLVEVNQLVSVFEDYGLTNEDRIFIKEQIVGKPLTRSTEGDKYIWRYQLGKAFLYEIVANKRNGVDVDKWDYFKRDCHHLGINSSFDHTRFIKFSRVIRVDGQLQICVRDKEAFNMYQMFHTRHALHRKAYQHKVVQAVEIMLVEAMKEVDEYIKIPGNDGKRYKMSECIDHMDAYTNLTDNIFHLILLSELDNQHVKRAQEILQDILRRKLYRCIGESVPITDVTEKDGKVIKAEILHALSAHEDDVKSLILNSRFLVQVAQLDFGKKYQNPVNDVRFFSKQNLNKAVPVKSVEVSSLFPQVFFKEQLVRVFLRPTGDKETDKTCVELLQEGFQIWCTKNTMQKPQESACFLRTPGSPENQWENNSETPSHPVNQTKVASAMKGKQRLSF